MRDFSLLKLYGIYSIIAVVIGFPYSGIISSVDGFWLIKIAICLTPYTMLSLFLLRFIDISRRESRDLLYVLNFAFIILTIFSLMQFLRSLQCIVITTGEYPSDEVICGLAQYTMSLITGFLAGISSLTIGYTYLSISDYRKQKNTHKAE